MDILAIAEEYFAISLSTVLLIGLLQGAILGRGIRNRFPTLKIHTRIVSICLLILFSINSLVSILKFARPEKLSIEEISMPENAKQGFDIFLEILGLDLGFGSLIAMFVSVTLILVFRFSELHSIVRYFMFGLSFIMLLVGTITKFTDYSPNQFQIFLYAVYHLGITFGVFFVTRRREHDVLNEIN